MALPTRYPKQGSKHPSLQTLVGELQSAASSPIGTAFHRPPRGYQGPVSPPRMLIGAVGQMQRSGVDPAWKPNPFVDVANDRIADFSLNRIPQPLPPNHSYQLPMQQQPSPASALADRAISGQSVMPASNYDPAVWGPGGRQYPTAMPAAPSGGLQPPVAAPRYGQSAQQAAMSLQNAQQQARDFTNQGVDRIFATNGAPVTTNLSFTGPPNPQTPVAQSMPYGSGSTLIRTADGRTILAGRSPDSRAEASINAAMGQNGGSIPQGVFNSIQQASAANSAARNSKMNSQRLADIKASDAAARDRQIVSNAMRFGVRNPLAIQTAQKMGIRLPGMPRISGDAAASTSNSQPTTQQIVNGLTAADSDQTYGLVQQGFKPSAAQGSDWASFLNNQNISAVSPQNIRAMQGHLRDAMAVPNFRADPISRDVLNAFLSGGPKAVDELKKRRAFEADKTRTTDPFLGGGFAF